MQRNWSGLGCDYRKYSLNAWEFVKYSAVWCGIVLVFAYAFYHELWAAVLGIPFLPLYLRRVCKNLQEKRQRQLRSQFRDAIQSIDGYLRAGYSVENAMNRSKEDIGHMWGQNSDMGRELRRMTGQMRMNVPAEDVWEDLAWRSGIFQMEQFACIFRIAKRSGGNVSEVIRSSMGQIAGQIRAEEEICTILAARVFQIRIMNWMPLGMLFYVGTISYDLLAVMYETAAGKAAMTVCLATYLFAYVWGSRMMQRMLGA